MCNFRVGQKVVCVDNEEWPERLSLKAVYEVSAVGLDFGEHYIGLVETQSDDGRPIHWRACRFRPVVERGTEKGMTILRKLLNKTGNPVEVDA